MLLCLHTVCARPIHRLQPAHVCYATCLLQAAQIQLDRAAQDFRQLHQERQDLIRQWDEARDAMKSRDEAIQVLLVDSSLLQLDTVYVNLSTLYSSGRCSQDCCVAAVSKLGVNGATIYLCMCSTSSLMGAA